MNVNNFVIDEEQKDINYEFGLKLIDFLFGTDETKFQEARTYFESLAQTGNKDAAEALYLMGIRCYSTGNYEAAFEFLVEAERCGSAEARAFLCDDDYPEEDINGFTR